MAEVTRSGFVSVVGRPNVGKSTLVNRMVGQKVSIVSNKAQTTRYQVRGVLERDDAQVVFVDTPGIHKARTLMGERLNEAALAMTRDVDVCCLVLDARGTIGRGDEWVRGHAPKEVVVVLNKCDGLPREQIATQLAAASRFEAAEYFPVSARTGKGVDALVDHLVASMPEGPRWYPEGTVRDAGEGFWVAELVREQLLAVMREELPHSIATRCTEFDWPRIRVEILVERDSQKGMVIGKGGAVLKAVGSAVRRQLPEGAYLELVVTVDRDWQRRADALERLGY